ncbi:MAG TPA: two-component regulator propeller domain-containing protein [Verrucomicrobiales bacterium]|nr:two-component regulator propeller domain-containing protein [Verrucomicrobiales bacterium]
MQDGLPEPTVNALAQTRDGFLWVGTNGGLARFDGVAFRNYGLQDGLRSIWIMALAEDLQGTLWIGTVGGGLSRWDKGKLSTLSPADGIPDGVDILSLAAGSDGSLWIGTEKGLLHRSGNLIIPVGDAGGLPEGQVRALLQDSRGTLWASVISKGLYKGNAGRFARTEKSPGGERPGGGIYSLLESHDGGIMAGTASLIWKQSGDSWEKIAQDGGVPKTDITALTRSRSAIAWAGTRSAGLYRSYGARFEKLETQTALDTNHIVTVLEDPQGLLWAGTAGAGLFRLSPCVMFFQGARAGLPGAITSLAEDTSGTLWAATMKGLFRRQDGIFRQITPETDSQISGNYPYMYAIATAGDGTVWAAGEGCVYRFLPGQPTRRFNDPPVKGEAIRALCADGNAIWMGTYYAGLLKGDAGGVKTVAPPRTFPGGITSLAVEATDTIWVGTSQGVHRWEKGQVRTWNTKDGLLTANIQSLHRDPDGTLWLGTLGGGLAHMKDGKFTHFTTRHGLISDSIFQIVPDDYGSLWLGTDPGIMCLDRRELDAVAKGRATELHPIVFGRTEGLLADKCAGGTSPTGIKAKDGRVLLPAGGGIASIDPRRLQDLQQVAPQASIQDIVLDRQPQALDEPLIIPPGSHRLEITYTAPVLRGGEWVRFRHKLEGLETDWVPAGPNRRISYDGLTPGRYTFHVSAATGKGTWSDSAGAFAFTVEPHLWQTLWFRAGGILLLAALGGGGAWLHLRSKHSRELAELERTRIQQAELAHLSRVSSLGELSGSLAHEINQPLGIILSNAQAAKRMLEQEPANIDEVREILGDIIDEDRRAGEVIKRLRALLKRGEANLQTISLNDVIADVLRLIRSDLIARHASVETELQEGSPQVLGDEVQLQQVLLNLILNACDAMVDNTPGERVVRITSSVQFGTARVSVEDQGCGLPQDANTRIFQPFFTTKKHGMGIGLSICKSIITAHQGELWAEPNTCRGATFHLQLKIL